MGIFDFLQKKGTVGSVVRWTFKNYHRIKSEGNFNEKSNILEHMFDIRYKKHPLLDGNAVIRLSQIKEDLELENLRDLYAVIYYIEMNIAPQDGKLFQDVFRNADNVLQKLNKKYKTDYK